MGYLMLLRAGTNPPQSRLEVNIQEFPFSQCCAYLHNHDANVDLGLKSAKDYRNALLACVGHIAQERLESGEILIRNAVARFVNTSSLATGLPRNGNSNLHSRIHSVPDIEPHVKSEGSQSTRVATPPAQRTVPRTKSGIPPMQTSGPPRQNITPASSNQTPVTHDPAKYTMLLNEYADHNGVDLEWAEDDIGTAKKPRFRISVTFQGVSAHGEGNKKKDAKHEAAFQACQKLGLQL
jgi:hypothetical protein